MPDDRPLQVVRRRLRRWRRRGLGPGVVVAVSGGSDSVGLLRILHALAPELGLALTVAHLDHGVRGEAAQADARFVAELAGSLGLPFELGRWEPFRPAHFESDARRARYAWLEAVARQHDARAVAVGHTRDDQAETILHRILRGTGPKGLAGIPARRRLSAGVVLVRPLLDLTREQIRSYLDDIGQPFRDDTTNADRTRTRARIRHDLLPRLRDEYNPRVADALVRLGRLSSRAGRIIEARAAEVERAVTRRIGSQEIVLDRNALSGLPRYLRSEVLRRSWRRAGWPEAAMSEPRWGRLATLARRRAGRVSIGGHVDAIATATELRLVRAKPGCG
jgi:tRNA(Ile)-lysidine synthase